MQMYGIDHHATETLQAWGKKKSDGYQMSRFSDSCTIDFSRFIIFIVIYSFIKKNTWYHHVSKLKKKTDWIIHV